MSKRIALCTVRDGKPCDSFCEGDYERSGLARALQDAEGIAQSWQGAPPRRGVDRVGVMVFSIDIAKPSRLIASFEIWGLSDLGAPHDLAAEHDAIVHPDGSPCPDGCGG